MGKERKYTVTAAGSLNIRSGPGTDYQSLGTLAQAKKVISPDIEGWLPILLDDDSIGWVAAKYLHEPPELEAPERESAPLPVQPSPAIADEYDFSNKEGTIAAIKAECRKQGIGLAAQVAYVLATVDWETGHTFKPVREAFWKSEAWRKENLGRYYPYYGRGFVQLTWKDNYRKYSEVLGDDLVNNPDLAMEPKNAVFILVHGFKTGAFTGKKIINYINAAGTDFHNARRCINGVDRAEEIAAIAQKLLEA